MTRTRFAAAGVILLGAATAAVSQPQPKVQPQFNLWGIPLGQPGRPGMPGRPVVQLKGVGKAFEFGPQQAAAWWAEKLSAELDQMNRDLAGVKLPPPARAGVTERIDAAIARAGDMEKALVRNNRDAWVRAFGSVEASLADLNKSVALNVGNVPVTNSALARAGYAAQQLGGVLLAGDSSNPAQVREAVVRVSAALEDQSERLRASVEVLPNVGAGLDRDVRRFARVADRFTAAATGPANPDQLRKDLDVLGREWAGVAGELAKVPVLPPPVRLQAQRVDGLVRRLDQLLGVAPPQLPGMRRMSVLAVASDADRDPRVVVYADDEGTAKQAIYPYDRVNFRSGVRVAVADLNGDGLPEVITVPGPGHRAHVRVFDGRDFSPIVAFEAFGGKQNEFGYNVAAADLTRDGRAFIAVAADTGGPPVVEVYDLAAGKLVGTVIPFPRNFDGGVRVAFGDVNGDGTPDLVTASGPGRMATTVKVIDGTDANRTLAEFLAVDDKYAGGVSVAAADLTKSNRAEIVLGLDAGTKSLVRVFDGRGKPIGDMQPYPDNFRGGVRVAIGDPDDNSRLKVIVSPGPGGVNLPVCVFRRDGKLHAELDPFPRADNGMFVASR